MENDFPTSFVLSPEAFAEFVRVCENPPAPTPALIELMRAHSKWRGGEQSGIRTSVGGDPGSEGIDKGVGEV